MPSRDESPPREPSPPQDDGATRVDMGDDLLEKTALLPMPGADPAQAQPQPFSAPQAASPYEPSPSTGPGELIPAGPIALEQVEDLLESARILSGEGLLEDAKKLLRKILMADPGRVTARKMLEEIHESELKQIFGESDLPRRRPGTRPEDAALEASADSVLRGLDRDLGLGVSEDCMPSLFRDREAMERFAAGMDRDFASSPASERIDLGIAFLEMGLAALAVRHFRAAVGALAFELAEVTDESVRTGASAPLLAATGLLAFALISDGRGFDATLALQPLLNDVEIARERKLDLMYLMGRAFETLDKPGDALGWYAQAAEIEPHYRDLDERLRRLARR
jgi:hypothetical protein